jgi:hypothetical protein
MSRPDNWVSADAASGAYLPKLAWTSIIRHRKVTVRVSPDDPALTSYWSQRRGRPGTPYSRGMATVAPHHPQSDHQAAHRTRTRCHTG